MSGFLVVAVGSHSGEVHGGVFLGRGLRRSPARVAGGVVATGVDSRAEWAPNSGAGGGAMGAACVVVDWREKELGGRAENCVGFRGRPPVVVLGGIGCKDGTGA